MSELKPHLSPARSFSATIGVGWLRCWKTLTGRQSIVWPMSCSIAGRRGRQVFFAGNGGSGGNANHLANDLLYALSKTAWFGAAGPFARQPIRPSSPASPMTKATTRSSRCSSPCWRIRAMC